MADRCQSLPSVLLEEPYKLHPWYILIRDYVPRVEFRFVSPKFSEKGELFYYDASSQTSTKRYREKESKSKKVIMTAVCSNRLHVEWSPHLFAPLNDKEKELLEAIPSTKQRYVTFNDQKDYLSFGTRLKIDDCVRVCAGALGVPPANDVHGKLKYIGPLKGQNGTIFGIRLSTNDGDCNGMHRSKRYFSCEPFHGIFLPINKLVPESRPDKPTQQETTKKVKHCRAADLGTEDVPLPTILKVGVTVEIATTLKDSPQKRTWVKGTIVNIVIFEGNTLFAVELERFKKPAVNTNGFYKGKSVCEPNKPNSTVIVKQSAIRQIHSSLTSDDHQSLSSSDIKFPPKTWKIEETAGETLSKVKGKSARKSEDQKDEKNKMLTAYSNVVKILPSSMKMNEHHFVTNSRLKGGTSWPSDNHQQDRKPPDGSKGFISNFRSNFWKSPDPPPYPFSDFHIEVITYDKKLCQGLIRGLQLEGKWEAEKGREAFFRLENVLQHWWTQIYEESKTQMQEFKILLVQYGREDLRDHIDKVPDRGMFDDTILNTAIFLARKDWRKFASELGMTQSDIDEKLKQDVLPDESLRIVFHVWYKQEQGCSKLSKLVKACHSIGQHTLAEEIEQGLSDVKLRKIAHQIELKSWQRLADYLLISPVRQDAFREKFKSLPNRVYHMLAYWSMIQPFGIDKVDGLASALYDVKLGYVAQTLLYRDFGDKDCEPVEGYVDPPENVEHDRVGMFKGIQGVHNSSYMDATIFSMFAYNSIFDAILFHDESTKEDITQVKDVLRTTIVNPLRSIGYVRGDHMMYFCNLLRGLDILQGLQAEEKDPAEFINALLQELMNVKPFLQISQGQNTTMESLIYQIFLDKPDNSDTSTVSDLLHLSFLQSDLKLAEVPECLIIQLHKYGKKNKLYDWIIPSLEMDINALIRDSPRKCSDCGKLASVECKDCTPVAADEDKDVIQSFCVDCYLAKHGKKKHKITNLSVPLEVTKMFHEIAEKVDEDDIAEKTQHLYPEHRMELFSVVCIETSHYVAFVKTGSGDGEQWVFFDSMADRRGDEHGYNIPEVAHLKNFRQQMESDSLRRDMKRLDFSKFLKRLLSDAYICFYRPVKNRTSSNMDTNSHTTHVRV